MTFPASLSAILIAAVVAVPVSNCADDPSKRVPQESVDFNRDVKPFFAKHCISCHGSEKQKHGLRLDRKADALKGGDSGVAVVPGKSV
ncbi:MAG TPA: c-type cytochrome domain-containing protein, partial [Gemmata sp.]|nr:c-type cytochrome domain-containing protein [Gemmata sp.]